MCLAEQNIFRTLSFRTQSRNGTSSEIRKSVLYECFKSSLLKLKRSTPNSLFNVSDNLGIKLIARSCLDLSHLREYKFNHSFQDTTNTLCYCSTNPLCSYGLESESTTRFFLHCQNFTDLHKCLMNEFIRINSCSLKVHLFFSL